MPGTASKATNGKQDTPLADNEPKGDPIPDDAKKVTVDLASFKDFDWGKSVSAPVKTAKLTAKTPELTEKDIPETIRGWVEDALKSDEYMQQTVPDEKTRAALVQFIRAYCYNRSAGRLSARITVNDEGVVRYSVSEFKERKSSVASDAKK